MEMLYCSVIPASELIYLLLSPEKICAL